MRQKLRRKHIMKAQH